MTTIEVRKVKDEDYSELMAIENQVWTNDNSPVLHHYNDLESYIEKMKEKLTFVAVLNDKVIGFVDVHPPTPLASHKHQWMIGIGVDPAFQSAGAGKKLLDFLKNAAPEYDIHKISLRVMGTNTRAIEFYKRNGFALEGILKDEFYINGRYSDDYLFAYIVPR